MSASRSSPCVPGTIVPLNRGAVPSSIGRPGSGARIIHWVSFHAPAISFDVRAWTSGMI
ncbi:hypothetical protein [uncultured Fretibacterium sp.]|uniref:hypothetical protein n=1 Tax=uncultured Fretibacterium sp. TaxID=1678694 RepID=UPI00262FB437|nr:hypothetical protein [uncultured Fretibacterium sp.]